MLEELLTSPRRQLLLVAVLAYGAVAAAVVSQFHFNMQPCPWCTLQRFIFLVVGTLALLGAALPAPKLRRLLAGLMALVALSGASAALWQHFVAAASNACKLTMADRIMQSLGLFELAPDLFVPTASCAEAAVKLLGVPYALWSLVLFLMFALIGNRVVMTRLTRR
jgi:disulfide bond formation protein DsbB